MASRQLGSTEVAGPLSYKNLRAKHGKYIWMMRRTGVGYCHETGVIEATGDQWTEFYNRYGNKQTWLKNNGLPHAELYDFVFEGNEPAGASIAEASNRSGINSIDLTMVQEDQSDRDGGDEAGENDEGRDTPSGREESQLSWTPTPTPTRALSSPVIRGTRRSASAVSDSSPRQRPLKKLKGPRSNLDELAKSIRHHTDSCAQLFRQSERERGVDDIERAVDDGKRLFSLAGGQLALFIKKMATPLQAVCWNMAGDDIEAKKAFLREMLGEDDVDRLVIEDV